MPLRPSFHRALLIPMAMGVVLILGMGCVPSTDHPGKAPSLPATSPSGFGALGTLTPSPTAPSATATSPAVSLRPPAKTLPPTSTLTETLPPPSATPTPDLLPLTEGKYDDTDPNIVYDLYWTALKNPSTANSYKGTIHASYDTGSEASFRFTGKRFRLGYKRGKSFGTVTVLIDDQPETFNEQAFDLVWNSPKLSPGDHFVRIIHQSGEAVNLDYIEILP
jgi:hypothetical protein